MSCRGTRSSPGRVGLRPGALRDGPQGSGDHAIGEHQTVNPAPHLQPTQTTRYEAIGAGETQLGKNTATQQGAHNTDPWMRILVLTVRSDEPHEERAAMSWYSRPRQCGEVALQERAMIRGPEPYHPHERIGPKSPENAGRRLAVDLQPGTQVQGCARLDMWPPSSGPARSPRSEKGRSGSLPAVLTMRGLGYLPKSPFQTGPYSGLGRKKVLQASLLQGSRRVERRCT